jgi:RNA recognition motif-containing protein
MKIFVAGLPFAVSDSELQELFEPYGTVGSAKVILDRETHKSRGFGFVEF